MFKTTTLKAKRLIILAFVLLSLAGPIAVAPAAAECLTAGSGSTC